MKIDGNMIGLVYTPSTQIVPPGRQTPTAVSSVSAAPPTVSRTRSTGEACGAARRHQDLARAPRPGRDHGGEPDRPRAQDDDALAHGQRRDAHAMHGDGK